MDREKDIYFIKVEKEGKFRGNGFKGKGEGWGTSLVLMYSGLMLPTGSQPRDACHDNCCGHMSREPLISLSMSSAGCCQGGT